MFGNLGNIVKVAVSMVPGPMGGVVGGILGGILGGGVKGGQNNQAMLGSLQQVLGKLFGQNSGSQGAQAPVLALPFSMNGQSAVALVQNPFGAFQGVEQQLGQISQMLNNLLGSLNPASGGAAAGAAPGASASAASGASSGSAPASTGFSSGGEGGWSKIDSMMEQAERLANSDKPSDQLKAQQLMQKAQRMFEMISKMMAQRSEMMSKAIQAIK